jgi:rubrerythrin
VKLDSVEKILEFAIQKEQDAADFYKGLGAKTDRSQMKDIFEGFAREEMGHKKKLEGVQSGKKLLTAQKNVQDLGIGEHLVDIDLNTSLSYQDALIVAMKSEKASYKLYSDLATATDDANLRELFETLAQEEAKHKLRFEIEYDDHVLKHN